mmetsp:Transcript_11164/g.18223  ORF Transcript_11164/g.18223 Transcript_11164/m.18223 type:complete len:108 (+) Transcript_11164:115-438(+)
MNKTPQCTPDTYNQKCQLDKTYLQIESLEQHTECFPLLQPSTLIELLDPPCSSVRCDELLPPRLKDDCEADFFDNDGAGVCRIDLVRPLLGVAVEMLLAIRVSSKFK